MGERDWTDLRKGRGESIPGQDADPTQKKKHKKHPNKKEKRKETKTTKKKKKKEKTKKPQTTNPKPQKDNGAIPSPQRPREGQEKSALEGGRSFKKRNEPLKTD